MINEISEKPDIFQLLELHEKRYIKELNYLLNNHERLSTAQGLERTKRVFDNIRKHLAHQDRLIACGADCDETVRSIEAYKKVREEILEKINQIVLMHVDEPEFLEGLQSLRKEVLTMAELEEARLYRKLRRIIDEKQLAAVREGVLEDLVSSGNK
ncbi:MAG TPA: hypothetical protein PKD05_00310 [Candidatus Melainabacteria bacterium]|nr:hypothetical protein [Candidatus Melainabacteria bacterium]HMP49974.1 hypothetical protein [Candidatus Melainabacteria bacterium]